MIIIDMEMPEKCQWDCPFCASDGGACLVADVKTSDVERPSDCPLREMTDADVKKHIAPRMLTVIPCELYEEMKSRWGASARPKGKWVISTDKKRIICSNCNAEHPCDSYGFYIETRFCSHCGAEMEGLKK